jgi:branched-chain amino acid transport system permease protein
MSVARLTSALSGRAGAGLGSRVGAPIALRPVLWLIPALAILLWTANGSSYIQQLALQCCIYATLALSLNLVAGLMGQYSLGHGALFGIGAYAAVLGVDRLHMAVGVALLFAIACTAIVGLVVGGVSLRLGGLYFALVTLALATVAAVVAEQWTSVTGGGQGVLGPIPPGFPSELSWAGSALVWMAGIAVLVGAFITSSIRRSPLYPVLAAVRESEPTALAAGARVPRLKVGMFCLSAALAGVAGWLFMFVGFVSPSSFHYSTSIQILVMVLLGGINTTLGPIVGAVIIILFPHYVPISAEWNELVYGAVLIAIIVLVPEGVVGLLMRGGSRAAAKARLARLLKVGPPGQAGRAPSQASLWSLRPSARPRETGQAQGDGAVADAPGQPSGQTVLEGEGITFRYGAKSGVYALSDVGLRIRRGSIHGVIGPNGSGKTTLISILSGFLRPEQGRVLIDGVPSGHLGPATRAGQGLLRTFQTAKTVGELSCVENCEIGNYGRIPGIAARAPLWIAMPGSTKTERELRARNLEVLDWLGLDQWADQRASEIPLAVQSGLQLAMCLAADPSIILLDEPMAGLTGPEIERLAERLRALRDAGMTVVLIEHHVRIVFDISDQITVLSAGKVIATGTPGDVRENPVVQEAYLGSARPGGEKVGQT